MSAYHFLHGFLRVSLAVRLHQQRQYQALHPVLVQCHGDNRSILVSYCGRTSSTTTTATTAVTVHAASRSRTAAFLPWAPIALDSGRFDQWRGLSLAGVTAVAVKAVIARRFQCAVVILLLLLLFIATASRPLSVWER